MNANTIQILNQYNIDIIELNLSSANINGILDLLKFTQLKTLNCSNNQITNLNKLPNSLTTLNCSHTKITNLDNLPNSLTTLNCNGTKITDLESMVHT